MVDPFSIFCCFNLYSMPKVKFLESQRYRESVLSVKTRAGIKSGNWLSTDIQPVCHYTAQGRVTYWNLKVASHIWVEGYTGLG